jgi:predicted RNase H-like HicB family nuclease
MNMNPPLQYNVIFRAEPEGGFTATVPTLAGCVSFGKDLNEAKEMIIDAMKGYIASLKKHGEPVPSDTENFVSLISLPISPDLKHA